MVRRVDQGGELGQGVFRGGLGMENDGYDQRYDKGMVIF